MKALLKRYATERDEGERFGDWTIRAGIIKETREGRDFHDDVSFFQHWASLCPSC